MSDGISYYRSFVTYSETFFDLHSTKKKQADGYLNLKGAVEMAKVRRGDLDVLLFAVGLANRPEAELVRRCINDRIKLLELFRDACNPDCTFEIQEVRTNSYLLAFPQAVRQLHRLNRNLLIFL